jgi:prepilin-type N-terminal cleavage/methylation domain-containing protein
MGGFSARASLRPGRKQGFTLIELLVVIGIIAVLAAIILPVYGRAREAARQTACTSNLHQIMLALQMYHEDFRGYPPPYDASRNMGGLGVLWASRILGGDFKVLRCPDDPKLDDPNPMYSSYNGWYNYFGYQVDGTPIPAQYDTEGNILVPLLAEETYAPVQSGVRVSLQNQFGQDVWLPTPDPTDTDPGTWTNAFPGLVNRNAPEETVVTHCPWHRTYYGAEDTQQDIIARLAGDVSKGLWMRVNWPMSIGP